MEGEVGNHLYQSATSADDLLLTPAPLQSPMSKFCLNFAFVSLVFKLLLILYIAVYHIFRQYIFSNVSSLQSSIFFLSTLILHMRLYWYLVCFFLPMIFFLFDSWLWHVMWDLCLHSWLWNERCWFSCTLGIWGMYATFLYIWSTKKQSGIWYSRY